MVKDEQRMTWNDQFILLGGYIYVINDTIGKNSIYV